MNDEGRIEADPTILIVEDDTELADLYASWLGTQWAVTTVYSGDEALEEITESLSVVLLDRRMPDRSGDDLIDVVRERNSSARIAMVTAVEPGFDIVEMGFDDYLLKPVTEYELVGAVEELLLRSAYDAQMREFYALASKRALLEQETSPQERAESDEYDDLLAQLRSTRRVVDETLSELSERGAFTDLCNDLIRAQ